MALRLADQLAAARQRRFVGRTAELALFEAALAAPELPFAVLYLFGPGGVGKTMLLGEFAARCALASIPVCRMDARDVEPTPDAFMTALRRVLGLAPSDSPIQALGARAQRQVLVIDTYEQLMPIDGWLREVVLPQLPTDVLVVLAGREPPPLAWRTDPGWQSLVRTVPLRNLSPAESRIYLAARSVPADQHASVLAFTHGHPLALSLVADMVAQRPNIRFQPEVAPDVIRALLEQLVQKVPGPAHRAALEACAVVRLTTESLLAELLALPDVHGLFDWLRSLSFIATGPHGLFPHDLVREALDADLRWRNPDWYADLHRRARTSYTNRFLRHTSDDLQRLLSDAIFLYRRHPMIQPFYDWNDRGSQVLEPARAADWPALVAIVAQHEGAESAQLAVHWFARQPQGVFVVRSSTDSTDRSDPVGFVAMVALQDASAADRDADPATRVAWEYLQRAAPLRPGEGATLFRFWMARDTYQAVSAIQSLLSMVEMRYCLTTPRLAYTFGVCGDMAFWEPFCTYVGMPYVPEVDFVVGGHRYGMFGHDWRAMPPMAWLSWLEESGVTVGQSAAPSSRVFTPLLVLSQEDFAAAVRAALRDYTRPDALRVNPLLRSRLVVERTGAVAPDSDRVTALRGLLKEACTTFPIAPREIHFSRTVYHTYIQPASTQEQAAELLDLPFGTYRRYLKAGVVHMCALLWTWELSGLVPTTRSEQR